MKKCYTIVSPSNRFYSVAGTFSKSPITATELLGTEVDKSQVDWLNYYVYYGNIDNYRLAETYIMGPVPGIEGFCRDCLPSQKVKA